MSYSSPLSLYNNISSERKQQMNKGFPILVAEDNPVSRSLLEKTLFKADYAVTSVENGRRALEVFNEEFFPIVLTDWMMPEMDGLQLCKAIRKNMSSGYVFIIVLTSMDSKDDIVRGLEAGADDYLTKPFSHTELIARLNTARRILELERTLKKANEEITILSITDPLTRCYNRGYLSEQLPKEIQRARRYGHHLSLALCDIDYFKNVNDTYGHRVGDEVLKTFADFIKGSIRENVDWVARYGGEEFLIVLPETDVSDACILAERIRASISQEVIRVDGKELCITASFGVTGFDSDMPDEKILPDDIINQADKYLYQAKHEGRNMIKTGPF